MQLVRQYSRTCVVNISINQAYLFSMQGKREQALAAAEESLRLRTEAGGRYFVALNKIILGAAYAQLRLREQAESHLTEGIALNKENGNDFDLAATYAHRALLRLSSGDEPAGLADVRRMFRCFKSQDYLHFFSWTSQLMEPLLSLAIVHGIEVEHARRLAAERLKKAVLPDGRMLPLLQIKTLGVLKFTVDGEGAIDTSQLTPGLRELLAMLIAAPEHSLTINEIQLALWPDSPEKKARSKFDNRLSRLRTLFDEKLGSQASKNYLPLEKSVLSLRYCQIDAARFQMKVRKGLEHVKRKEFWQAENALFSAHRLWAGEFITDVQAAESVAEFRTDLLNFYLRLAKQLVKVLDINGQQGEAIQVAVQSLKYDRTNETMIRWIYNEHSKNGDLVNARKSP